jgi:diaminohydroxyphosphoribosylaminopyrimidine deaminase/5-amino-6-(5-phosphoribosylamino)uracil reductase
MIAPERYMKVALSLARRQLGRTHPNPSVGAVIVKNGQIIANGITANGGRPHAETMALNDAGENAKNADLYVTLEPCSHHGKTPPCINAIIRSGIKAVYISCRDPNPEVNGAGIEALKKAGIKVIENICHKEALEINRGFFSVIKKKRPYIALKIATSLDEKITNPKGRWLTGEPARNYGHLLRARYDAILTGAGTVIADDPLLTCRLPGLERYSPVRIVMDRDNNIPKSSNIMKQQEIAQTIIMNDKTLDEVTRKLAKNGITRLLVEGGAKLTASFLESGMADRIYWFRAPIIVGENGLSLSASLSKLANFKQIENIKLGEDNLEILECSRES